MLPIIELRGAIPVATALGLDPYFSYLICIIGNILPVPFIFLFATKVLYWGKDKKYTEKVFTFFIKKGFNAGRALEKKAGLALFLSLTFFVAIPLPGTGAWTGSLAASLLGISLKKGIVAVALGVVIAGCIMLLLSQGFLALK